MLKSMTGYGSSQGHIDGASYTVDIKTVNNRYYKARIKLPDVTSFLEKDIEKLLRGQLPRGMVNYTLQLKEIEANVLFNIDENALKMYLEKFSRLSSSVKVNSTIDISGLLAIPGIIQPVSPDEDVAERARVKILETSRDALAKVKLMRAAEGESLASDLENYCERIKQALEQIRGRSKTILEDYQRKLKNRVEELLAGTEVNMEEGTLAREVAVFAERSDISEEIARLVSHLQQFAECCQSDEPAGRKLDFITQEMLREANTIASKASDTETIRCVVDMKCWIERIKEQVQNIE